MLAEVAVAATDGCSETVAILRVERLELLAAAAGDSAADPKIVLSAKYRLGWCYQKLGKFDKAAEVFARETE